MATSARDIQASFRSPWGKFSESDGGSHHLAHHCADVAACFLALCEQPTILRRLEAAAGRRLSRTDQLRLAALVFLHDVGKLRPGFQAQGWSEATAGERRAGHVLEGLEVFAPGEAAGDAHPAAVAINIEALAAWVVTTGLVRAVISHHGRPVQEPRSLAVICRDWRATKQYDPVSAAREFARIHRQWFAAAFEPDDAVLPDTPAFEHLICGLTALADWIGSDIAWFPFQEALDEAYFDHAIAQAREAIAAIGADPTQQRAAMPKKPGFADVTGFAEPREQQRLVGDISLDERLIILEAETVSGKTEAALWRYAQLLAAGAVDGLYFAVPTRAAATQLHERVCEASERLFGAVDPQPILAIPGYLRAGEATGRALPDWRVLWDDAEDEQKIAARWAAEHSKRFLAAQIAVGTVDQAMLAALKVKHAHLRGAALSRSFLVIDEAHASDSWMTRIQKELLDAHLALGGYAMLMSATLGSVARADWLDGARPSFEEAIKAPYPAVWSGPQEPRYIEQSTERIKAVAMTAVDDMSAEAAADRALAAARASARVLVIRNTVRRAVETQNALERAASTDDAALMFRVGGVATLHHSRFAGADRRMLDRAVEATLSTRKDRALGGGIVVGTQTLEQSLDIDADLLVTDLCPIDVLLQRTGRLHRHKLFRPDGFEEPRCVVLSPNGGLERLTAPAFDNGLGAWNDGGMFQGVYVDLAIVELTRRLVADAPIWRIPEMNRWLVEAATHPERVEALCDELGENWRRYQRQVFGGVLAQRSAAGGVVLDRTEVFDALTFPPDEAAIRTRLGAEGPRIPLPEQPRGPFGEPIEDLPVAPVDARGLDLEAAVHVEESADGVVRVWIGDAAFIYDRFGVMRET